jgi:hypothetical protein
MNVDVRITKKTPPASLALKTLAAKKRTAKKAAAKRPAPAKKRA